MTGLLTAVSPQLPLCFSLHRHKSFTFAPPQLSVAKDNRHQQQRLSPFISLSSLSTSSTASTTEQQQVEDSPPFPSTLVESVVDIDIDPDEVVLSSSGCKACGREQIERGCNGEGRIQGGIATVPGFGWWPIKAYRPCPGFLASGGNYRRRGQSMDEVAFGGGKRGTSMDDLDELEKRKKGKDRRRFKR